MSAIQIYRQRPKTPRLTQTLCAPRFPEFFPCLDSMVIGGKGTKVSVEVPVDLRWRRCACGGDAKCGKGCRGSYQESHRFIHGEAQHARSQRRGPAGDGPYLLDSPCSSEDFHRGKA